MSGGGADRFTLAERVGIGATAEVIRGFDLERRVPVAIKRLHEHLAVDPMTRDRFEREARLSARIKSEHVVGFVDAGIDADDRPYLVLEWLEGEDLAHRMRASHARLGTAEALTIARQASLGLFALHEAGIVHRDVKPGNLFLAEQGGDAPFAVKLLDLGVAHDNTSENIDGVALGTPFYMSPEQARGDAEIGIRSDLFSLGVLLFELLSGKKPFVGDDAFSVLAKIVLQAPPRLSDAWPDAPPALDALVARALARDPEARFSSAREMADALAAIELAGPFGAPLAEGFSRPPALLPSDDHLVGVIFGRLPLSSNVGRTRGVFQRIAEHHGGVVIPLLGRGVAAVFEGECADGLLRAADAALDLVKQVTGVRLSLVTGGALPSGVGLSASVIERGTRALERPRADVNEPPVRIDDETAQLLEEQYAIEGAPGSLSLRGTRGRGSTNS
ncbi:protein kinase domain-containing protein [Polyangium spumosum]|uniref:Protein kinase n=1 Tax=Polyangium spumosum TaxID=889282 RepID=A0A6N7PTV0_9BACT|nr:protein kinase [Polyangium spumosum]MRG93850.1 protein kinase [Polyangium spumosum]